MKGKQYSYKGHTWASIYGNINTNRIFPRFKKGNHYLYGFSNMTRNIVSIASFTLKNNEERINLLITDHDDFFEFSNSWLSTSMKSSFLEKTFNEIVNENANENKYEKWRYTMFRMLYEIHQKATDFKLVVNKDYNIEISFKVYLKNLQKEIDSLAILKPSYVVNLTNKSPEEIFDIGLSYLYDNNEKCINILKTILDDYPISGFIIGIAYYHLRNCELSTKYIVDAVQKVDEIELSDEFIGVVSEILATNELNLGIANDRTIRLFFNVLDINQSETAMIKLSYIILQQNLKHLKEFALENISIAINFNLKDDNEFSKSAGFHIICCILLWNDKFNNAEEYHHYFLTKNNSFLTNYKEHIEGYVTLALAKNNINFISNLVLDFPHIKEMFLGLFHAWDFSNLEIENKTWSNLDLYNYKKILNTKEQYCD